MRELPSEDWWGEAGSANGPSDRERSCSSKSQTRAKGNSIVLEWRLRKNGEIEKGPGSMQGLSWPETDVQQRTSGS
jgi:hypothetical protein